MFLSFGLLTRLHLTKVAILSNGYEIRIILKSEG